MISETLDNLVYKLREREPLITVYENFISRRKKVNTPLTVRELISVFKKVIVKFDKNIELFEHNKDIIRDYLRLLHIDDYFDHKIESDFIISDILLPYYDDLAESIYANNFPTESIESNINLNQYFDFLYDTYNLEIFRYNQNNKYRITKKCTYELFRNRQQNLSREGTPEFEGGSSNKKKTINKSCGKKIIQGKERCIYKILGSRKEYIKYKGELIAVRDFKKFRK